MFVRRSYLTDSVFFFKQILRLNPLLCGSASATCSTLLFQPLDLVKTRLQSHVMVGAPGGRVLPIVLDVVKRDRVIGLWKGTVPSLMRNVPGIGLYFFTIDVLRNSFCSQDKSLSPAAAAATGVTARTFAGVVLLPMTVLKTKYESGLFKYSSLTNAVKHTYSSGEFFPRRVSIRLLLIHASILAEGTRGLFRGTSATLLRDVPYSGL